MVLTDPLPRADIVGERPGDYRPQLIGEGCVRRRQHKLDEWLHVGDDGDEDRFEGRGVDKRHAALLACQGQDHLGPVTKRVALRGFIGILVRPPGLFYHRRAHPDNDGPRIDVDGPGIGRF